MNGKCLGLVFGIKINVNCTIVLQYFFMLLVMSYAFTRISIIPDTRLDRVDAVSLQPIPNDIRSCLNLGRLELPL